MSDIGSYRPVILPSPRIYERMRARADEVRVEESLRQVRACLDAETITQVFDEALLAVVESEEAA